VNRAAAIRHRRGESGIAMALAVLAVFLCSVAVELIGLSLAVSLRSAQQEARGVRLTAMCDAALAQTLSKVAVGGSSGMASRKFAGGSIASRVQTIDATHLQVTAIAVFENKRRTAVAQVTRSGGTATVTSWRRVSG
jgi:hypothetical protein